MGYQQYKRFIKEAYIAELSKDQSIWELLFFIYSLAFSIVWSMKSLMLFVNGNFTFPMLAKHIFFVFFHYSMVHLYLRKFETSTEKKEENIKKGIATH